MLKQRNEPLKYFKLLLVHSTVGDDLMNYHIFVVFCYDDDNDNDDISTFAVLVLHDH